MVKRIFTEQEKINRKAYDKKYNRKNKEKRAKKDAEKWKIKGEEIKQQKKEFRATLKEESPEEYEKFLEKNKLRLRKYYDENRNEVNRKQREYLADNKDKVLPKRRIYRELNKDYINKKRKLAPSYMSKKELEYKAIYREENRDKERARTRKWQKANPEKVQWHNGQREQKILQATIGGDMFKDEILAIYKESARKTKNEGVQYHVDHIIPLVSKNVCGLHIPQNLRIITAEENIKKKNKLVPELLCCTNSDSMA